jgi:MraZ protein
LVFTGTYERSLDGKGRLVLPPKLRAKLPEGGYLTPHAGCLALFPSQVFEEMLARMREQVRTGELERAALVGASTSAEEVELDAQGRIVLPPRLRAFAELETDVVVTGVYDHVQIWSSTAWQAASGGFTDSAVAVLADGRGV